MPEYCANCDQLQDRCAKLVQDKTTAELQCKRLTLEVNRLVEENKRLMATIAAIEPIESPKSGEPEKNFLPQWVDGVENTMQVMARVILKLARLHKSERLSDQIAPADQNFLEKLTER